MSLKSLFRKLTGRHSPEVPDELTRLRSSQDALGRDLGEEEKLLEEAALSAAELRQRLDRYLGDLDETEH